MRVYFEAHAKFTDSISVKFFNRLRWEIEPFIRLSGVGGRKDAEFNGVLELESTDIELVQYQITEALVRKVEALSRVGVESIDFSLVSFGLPEEKEKGTLILPPKGKTSKVKTQHADLVDILVNQYGYAKAMTVRMRKKELLSHVNSLKGLK